MKITHVIPALTKGGAERVLIDLANEASAAGHAVTVVVAHPEDPALGEGMLRPEIMVRHMRGAPSRYRRYLRLPAWLLANWSWLREQDVVHCHLTFAAALGTQLRWLRRITGSKRPRIVETFHGVGMPIRRRQLMLSTFLASGRDGLALMARDAHWTRFAERNPALPLAIIPNGVAVDDAPVGAAERAAYREGLGIPADAPLVGTIGRVQAERNPLAIVAAFAGIARQAGADVHFLMGGTGPMLDAVRAEGERLGIGDRLHLPGMVLSPRTAMAAMDVYVSVNVGPITGIAGLEAAAGGTPVVAVQALAEHRRGEADWIWSDPDPALVAQEAARLLADAGERTALSQRQRAHVLAHHSAGAMARAYETLYARAGAESR